MVVLKYLNEIWKDIPDFEGKYQASNFGRIKSLNYNRTGKEQLLKFCINNHGYLFVRLFKNGKVKNYLIHRLVWIAFHGAIPEGMQINHIDEDKTNNRLDNLELMTCKENNNWGTANERRRKTQTNRKDLSKPVFQYDKQGNLIKGWCSAKEVERQLGFSQDNICRCCTGNRNRKSAYGFVWRYKN